MKNVSLVVKQLKKNAQDFEWYPTTNEILERIKRDIWKQRGNKFRHNEWPSFSMLDIGAGNGKSLDYLKPSKKYAIEKSLIHLNELPADIFVIGTEFYESTLIDKKVDVIFCNPPYSEYVVWTEKIIKEANAETIYIIIPERWNDNEIIKDALKFREANAVSLGRFDFLNAERQARANVEIVMIDLTLGHRRSGAAIDPFALWFEQTFSFNTDKEKQSDPRDYRKATLEGKLENQLTTGKGVIPALVELYQHEQAHLFRNYKAVQQLDASILQELEINVKGLREAFKQRIAGLKNLYWEELFKHYQPITSRLVTKTRKKMLDTLSGQVAVDFTESNALAITAWAIKNANQYYDSQLVDLVKEMVEQANVVMYKSNQRTMRDEDWRYKYEAREKLSHYGLELRVILDRYRAITCGGFDYDYPNGLNRDAHDFVNDILVVAGNLGYSSLESSYQRQWESNKKQDFHDTEETLLMSVKAFKNGNLHIKFNQGFIKKLNIEFGRLNGWLKDWADAARELKDVSAIEATAMFNANYQALSGNVLKQLTC